MVWNLNQNHQRTGLVAGPVLMIADHCSQYGVVAVELMEAHTGRPEPLLLRLMVAGSLCTDSCSGIALVFAEPV